MDSELKGKILHDLKLISRVINRLTQDQKLIARILNKLIKDLDEAANEVIGEPKTIREETHW